MDAIVLAIHVLVSLSLVGLILIQHGKGADAGAAALGGGSASLFGSRGASSFLSRTSALLATVFFVTSLSLAYFSGKVERVDSIMGQTEMQQQIPSTPADLPELP